ncbi:MAG: O-antigen ligase family protein [Bacteroidota bacterium]
MKSVHGALFLTLVGVSIAYLDSKLGVKISVILFALIGAVLFAFICFLKIKYAYYVSFILCFTFPIIERRFNIDLPLSLIIQVLSFMMVFFILIKKIVQKDFSFAFLRNNVTYALLMLMGYNFLQGLNPNMESYAGWGLVVKGSIGIFAVYFVVLYLIHEDSSFLNQFVKLWILMATIAALYACYQEWFGLFNFEIGWIRADPLRFKRIFIKGAYRKFSLLSDPANFGIFMAASGLMAIPFLLKSISMLKKLFLLISVGLIIMATGYSGTRTAYAMIPAGLVLFGLMTINKSRTLYLSAAGVMLIAFVLFGPIHGNPTVHRVRTLINQDDPSLNVRNVNRSNIQSYVNEHPIGGGLMTTGTGGLKYNPNHELAGFPPDSGFLQTALETGYIGLFINMLFFFIGLSSGIKNYYSSNDENTKILILSLLSFLFAVCVGMYAQAFAGQLPISLVLYPSMGILASLSPPRKPKVVAV